MYPWNFDATILTYAIVNFQKKIALNEYTKSITENKTMLEDLKAKNASLAEDITNALHQLNVFKAENIKLKYEIMELNSLIITDAEMEAIVK